MDKNELSVVIVTFKSEDKIYKCLDSIPNNLKIFVIENSNNSKFKSHIENIYPNVKCILTGSNKGYAKANNIGLKMVRTKFALILNPDTKLEKNSINKFFDFVRKKQNFWLVGPINNKIKDNLFDGTEEIIEVENLKGFGIFFNMEKFNQNFFDENFFLYFEEIDLCKNVIAKGGKIYLDKNIIISHDGASSVKTSEKIELEKSRNWHWMWSTFYFHKKYKGFLIALLIIFPKLFSSSYKTIFYFLIFNKDKHAIYRNRLSGILNSIIGKKSWYRPSLD